MTDPLLPVHLAGNARAVLRPLLVTTMVGLAVVLVAIVTEVTVAEIMALVILIVATASALVFLRSGRVALAAYCYVTAQLVTGVVAIIAYGSVRSVSNLAFVGAVVVAGVFLGRRALVGTMMLTSAVVGALVYAEASGAMRAIDRPVGWLQWLVFSVGTVLIGLSVHYSRTVALEAHERQQQELAERIQAEATVRLTEDRLRLSMEATHQGWFDLDIPSGNVVASAQFAQMAGFDSTKPDANLQNWMDAIHTDDRSAVLAAFQDCLASGTTQQSDYRLRTRTGEWKWVRSIAQVVAWDDAHRPLRMTGTHMDISDEVRATEALRSSEERFRAVVELSPEGIVIHDEGRIAYANPAAARILGAEAPELLVGRQTRDFVHPDFWNASQQRLRRAQETGQPSVRTETVYRRLDGSDFDAESVGMPITVAGRPCTVVVFSDITERMRGAAALRDSEVRYRTLFEQAGDYILLLEVVPQGPPVIRDANITAVRGLGYSRDELIGAPVTMLEPDVSREALERRRREAETTGSTMFEARKRRKDGSSFDSEVRATEFMMQGKRMSIATERDISERKRTEAERSALEAELRQAQKMESVGRLAGGVAHDFNNMLGVIIGVSELGMMELDPGHPLRTQLEEIHDAARRSADLTRQLLTFARKQTVAPAVLDLNEAVARSVRMLERLIGENISLEWRPGDGLWHIYMDASQVDQILANLCVNAKDAIRDVGTLRIETENCVVDERLAMARADAAPGEYVRLAVSDTGIGMSSEIVSHIFEPFFTTKAAGLGTGLGLATVYGAVRQNGGFITVSSIEGAGTTFEIFLPRHQGPVGDRKTPHGPLTAVGQGCATILLVEDEAALLALATRALERAGYLVLTADDPAKAIELAAAHPGDIDLLLTDVVMPGMNGRSLADALRAQRPGIEWLFMSGFAADVTGGEWSAEDAERFIAKPFTVSGLIEKVRSLLDRT